MRIKHQCHRRPDRQRRVPEKLSLLQIHRSRRRMVRKQLVRRLKHSRISAQLDRNVDQRRQHHHIQHNVLHNRNHRRRAQSARVRIRGQNHKRRGQRPLALHPHRFDHNSDPHQLQRNVRHQRQHSGQRNRNRQPAVPIPASHKVRKGYVTVTVTNRPQPRQHHHHVRIRDHRIRHREETHRSASIQQSRYSDHRIRRIKISTDQKPGHPRAEASPRQPPLFERTHSCLRPAPPRRPESSQRHQRKKETEDH